ncbi:hypothetical protein DUI87_13944 [Hirundo rustica rustica]|uniref:Uncharacterized protein n=1 Tax=Hirundo rustica rustica TaxID=333673 RepID=A0A3M0K726_HIRRU|nr:hypothetical protein DUI87_13944 [Hirundo rustica rustica]
MSDVCRILLPIQGLEQGSQRSHGSELVLMARGETCPGIGTAARNSQEQPETARIHQEPCSDTVCWDRDCSQEQPGTARKQPGTARNPALTLCAETGTAARNSQEQPGTARNYQEQPGTTRNPALTPCAGTGTAPRTARNSQEPPEPPGTTRNSQEPCSDTVCLDSDHSQEQPGTARNHQEQPGTLL